MSGVVARSAAEALAKTIPWQEARQQEEALLRDVFGNMFGSSNPLPPAALAWNGRTTPRLAEVVYEERRMPAGTLDTGRMAILADALLDAGCDDENLIQHCRPEAGLTHRLYLR